MDLSQIKTNVRTTQINGKDYTITLLPTKIGLKVKENLIKGLAPALASFLDEKDKQDKFDLLPDESVLFTNVALALVANMDSLDLVATVEVLVSNSYCNGDLINFDEHFAGNYGELVELVVFSLKENYSSFFARLPKGEGSETLTLREKMEALTKGLS